MDNLWQSSTLQAIELRDNYKPSNSEYHAIVPPGLGDEVDEDRETVVQMVEKLKEEIKFMNAFVILFNGQV